MMVETANNVSDDGPPTKRRKSSEPQQDPNRESTDASSSSHKNLEGSTSHQNSGDDAAEQEEFTSFDKFEIIQVLSNMEEEKKVAVEGRFPGKEGSAVVLLEKQAFNLEKLPELMSGVTTMKKVFHNDIYYNKQAITSQELSAMNAVIIYPAREDHIKKHSKQMSTFINETGTMYEVVTEPYIKASAGHKQWIYNILDHKSEVDRIVYEDPDPVNGFILVPDLKWSGENLDCLYLQAIVRRRDISTIRDLRREHLPLLRNLQVKGSLAIKEKYGVRLEDLRIYFHYQPSYYHLHCHFTALSYNAPGKSKKKKKRGAWKKTVLYDVPEKKRKRKKNRKEKHLSYTKKKKAKGLGIWAGKAHLLPNVIGNLEVCGEYYKKAVLPFTIKKNHPLLEKFVEQGFVSKVDSI